MKKQKLTNKQKADLYCEEYGIFPYRITNQTLLYYANYPAYIAEPKRTYKVVVRLSNMKEKRTLLKRWSPLGRENFLK